jgi:hypothetical protein
MAQERVNGADMDHLEGEVLSDQMLLPIEAIGRGELWNESLIIFIRLRFLRKGMQFILMIRKHDMPRLL